jgi:D-amino-acid dehydrogenase
MKIAIIGAGAVGVTTAHVLSKAGHSVHVFEQGSSAAQGASFAHSGVLGAGSVQPFFSTQFVKHWCLSLLGKPKHLHWRTLSSLGQYALAFKAAWHTRRSAHSATTFQLQRLAQFSALTAARYLSGKRMEFEQGSDLLVLHTQLSAFESASLRAKALNADISSAVKKNKILSAEQAQDLEPALAKHSHLQGAIVYPSESYGNCALFTKQLKLRHQKNGVQYQLNTPVTGLAPLGNKWQIHARASVAQTGNRSDTQADGSHTNLDDPDLLFDAVVVAAGIGSVDLLAALGLKFPVIQIQTYSITLPMNERMDAPRCSVLDAATGSTLVPMGNRIRVSGQHQLAANAKPSQTAYKALGQTIQHWYPFASKVSQASYDSSTSCIAIDSKPILGATSLPGLYLNFAHGPYHWALAFGCAQALADELVNAPDRFELSAFSPNRFV